MSGDRLRIEYVPLAQVRRWDRNPKPHDIGALIESFRRYGFKDPMKYEPELNGGQGGIVEGNGRTEALQVMYQEDPKSPPRGAALQKKNGTWAVPVLFGVDAQSEAEAEAYALDHNALTVMGGNFGPGWEAKLYNIQDLIPVAVDLAELKQLPISIDGSDLDYLLARPDESGGKMTEKFIVPPFSVLDQRAGYWRERKRQWLRLGIDPGGGRPTGLLDPRQDTRTSAFGSTKPLVTEDGRRIYQRNPSLKTTSELDPVLCELAYRWWCPPGGHILNPAAGESVSGVIAGLLKYTFTGIDVRQEQVDFNTWQAEYLKIQDRTKWVHGDGRNADKLCRKKVDFILSCPPYYDLEVYSDQDDDLSTFDSYEEFMEAYDQIVAASLAKLKDDRFAVFIVGEIRDKHGNYRNFVGDTVESFRKAGAEFYNELILVSPVGSALLRAGQYLNQARKVAKTHQNVLVFLKGDAKKATEACGHIEVELPDKVIEEAKQYDREEATAPS